MVLQYFWSLKNFEAGDFTLDRAGNSSTDLLGWRATKYETFLIFPHSVSHLYLCAGKRLPFSFDSTTEDEKALGMDD